MVTVHALGGSALLRAAVHAAAPFPGLKVLAITVITSLSDGDLPEIGLPASVRQQVERLAYLAAQCGCHGVVASALEAEYLSQALPTGMLIVTPGIQLAGLTNDQVRVGTPAAARKNGATHIVVGRTVTQAESPTVAFKLATQVMAGVRGT